MPSKSQATLPITALVRGVTLCMLMFTLPAQAEERPSLTCDIGPVTKIFGQADWLVYSCNDKRSVVVVSAPGNPAAPFYFIFSPQGEGYGLHGEGTGSKEATAAAYADLRTLTPRDIVALVDQTRSGTAENADVSVKTLGDGHYLLSLRKSQSIPVRLGQLEMKPKAKALCKSDDFEFGKYTFESSEELSAKSGADKKDYFLLKQEIHCVTSAANKMAGAKSGAVVKDDKLIERLTLEYFRAKDGGAYRDAYALLTDSMQAMSPFEKWRQSAKAFNNRAGKARNRKAIKITWYHDPPSASPGLYAAADFASTFDNIEIHCGYVVWRQEDDGTFRLTREEENYMDKKTQQGLDPDKLAAAKAKLGVGCR
ncbi:MAG TPA: DUF4019 domain-containing protein [Candidatus Binatia bacterium]